MSLEVTNDNKINLYSQGKYCDKPINQNVKIENSKLAFKSDRKDSFEPSTKHSGRNFVIGAALLTALGGGIAFLVSKGRSKKAAGQSLKALSKNIDFTPAKTLEEAKAFGKEHLGIETYSDIDNLEIINWLNGGIVKASNKAKDTLVVPKIVKYSDLESDVPAAVDFKKDLSADVLFINKSIDHVYDKYIEKFLNESLERGMIKAKDGKCFLSSSLKNEQSSDDINNLLTRFKTNASSLNLMEKSELSNIIDNIYSMFEQFDNIPMEKIKQLLKDKNIIWKQKKLGIEDVQKLDIEEQRAILTSLLKQQKAIGSMLEYRKGNPYKVIEHEMAHILHRHSAGNDVYKMYKEEEIKTFGETDTSIIRDFLRDSKKQQTARKVSAYSGESPAEFVAETFALLSNNEKLPDDVMKLYREYKGPEVLD